MNGKKMTIDVTIKALSGKNINNSEKIITNNTTDKIGNNKTSKTTEKNISKILFNIKFAFFF